MNNNNDTKELKKIPSKSKSPSVKNKNKKKSNKKVSPQRVIAVFLATIALVGCIGLGAVAAYAMPIINDAPELKTEDFVSPSSSEIVDANGVEYHISGHKLRDNITYDQLSNSLIDAFVAGEDSRFFQHNGFDIPRFTKAALNNLVDSVKSGKLVFGEGGSTFTMQLIKNTLFVDDGSTGGEIIQAQGGKNGISRKITEIYLSQKLEGNNTLNKELILELYLNRIDFGVGNNIVGVENSAQAYFGKSASDLNTVESAFMAGVINAPFANSPYYSIKNANDATQRVLYNMHYHGYISDEEYAVAKNVKIEDLLVAKNIGSASENLPYQSYIDAVYKEVEALTGFSPVYKPMRITTSIDFEVQAAIDKVQAREIANMDISTVKGTDPNSLIQAASAVINNKTGEIVGLFGRYDYNKQLMLNLAAENPVNPGSTLKPVLSYAPAYENLGWASTHVITDEPIDLGGMTMVNYNNTYLGQITTNMAVGDSRNIPAIKAFQEVQAKIGYNNYQKYAADIGLLNSVADANSFNPHFAIGNSPFYVTPVDLAGATSMLFNEGKYIKPHTVTKIEFKDGSAPIIPDYAAKQVISPGAAYLATSNMKYVVDSGLNGFYTNILKKSYPTYAKTGTVQYDKTTANSVGVPVGSQKDRLMIAATSDYTIATWTGFEPTAKKPYFSSSEASFNLAGKLNSYILDVLANEHGRPQAIPVSNDLTQISHITGTFPYQSPLANMNPNLISKGYILKKYATLAQATPQSLKDLASTTASATPNKNKLDIKVDIAAYPDPSKLTVAKDILEMSDSSGKKFTGKRLYDESWLYGAVRYKTEVRVNGQTVKEVMSETENQAFTIDYPKDVSKIEICSYYTFELSNGVKSNVVCQSVDIPEYEQTTSVPQFIGRLFTEIIEWANSNSLPNPILGFNRSSNNNFGTIIDISPSISGNSVQLSELKEKPLNVVLADSNVRSGIRVRDFMDKYSNFISVTNSDINENRNKTITGYIINGANLSDFWLGEHYGGSVTLVYGN